MKTIGPVDRAIILWSSIGLGLLAGVVGSKPMVLTITSIFDEFHPMITLKQNQIFRNQNLLDVSPPRIILLTKHVSFRTDEYWGLTAGFACLPTLS